MGEVTVFPTDRTRRPRKAVEQWVIEALHDAAERISEDGDSLNGYVHLVHLLGRAMSDVLGADQASAALELEAALLVGREPGSPEPAA